MSNQLNIPSAEKSLSISTSNLEKIRKESYDSWKFQIEDGITKQMNRGEFNWCAHEPTQRMPLEFKNELLKNGYKITDWAIWWDKN